MWGSLDSSFRRFFVSSKSRIVEMSKCQFAVFPGLAWRSGLAGLSAVSRPPRLQRFFGGRDTIAASPISHRFLFGDTIADRFCFFSHIACGVFSILRFVDSSFLRSFEISNRRNVDSPFPRSSVAVRHLRNSRLRPPRLQRFFGGRDTIAVSTISHRFLSGDTIALILDSLNRRFE